jgi:hypothetical protein
MTTPMDRLPDFVIIGAGKSASTWLHLALRQHPAIFMPEGEIAFFEDPQYDEKDLSPLTAEFASAPADATLGIKRPNYLCTPECAPRLAKHLPKALLIAILRNPVDRAISQYYHLIRSGRLPVAPPDAVFEQYLAGRFDAPFAKRIVLEFGLYAQGIACFRRVFPSSQMLIITDLDMRHGSLEVFKRACRFIGVRDDFVPPDISRPRNQGVYFSPVLSLIQSLNRRGQSFETRTGLETPREDFVGKAARRLAVLGSRLSAATRIFVRDQEPPVSAATRASLLEFYLPDIQRLEDMMNTDLSPWKSLPDA